VRIAGVLDLAQGSRLPLDVVPASSSTAPFAVGLVASAGTAGFPPDFLVDGAGFGGGLDHALQ